MSHKKIGKAISKHTGRRSFINKKNGFLAPNLTTLFTLVDGYGKRYADLKDAFCDDISEALDEVGVTSSPAVTSECSFKSKLAVEAAIKLAANASGGIKEGAFTSIAGSLKKSDVVNLQFNDITVHSANALHILRAIEGKKVTQALAGKTMYVLSEVWSAKRMVVSILSKKNIDAFLRASADIAPGVTAHGNVDITHAQSGDVMLAFRTTNADVPDTYQGDASHPEATPDSSDDDGDSFYTAPEEQPPSHSRTATSEAHKIVETDEKLLTKLEFQTRGIPFAYSRLKIKVNKSDCKAKVVLDDVLAGGSDDEDDDDLMSLPILERTVKGVCSAETASPLEHMEE